MRHSRHFVLGPTFRTWYEIVTLYCIPMLHFVPDTSMDSQATEIEATRNRDWFAIF